MIEMILELIYEPLLELGIRALPKAGRRVWLGLALSASLGASTGWGSLFLVAARGEGSTELRALTLLASPILGGLAMMAFSAWRPRPEAKLRPGVRFAYGFTFALTFTALRLAMA